MFSFSSIKQNLPKVYGPYEGWTGAGQTARWWILNKQKNRANRTAQGSRKHRKAKIRARQWHRSNTSFTRGKSTLRSKDYRLNPKHDCIRQWFRTTNPTNYCITNPARDYVSRRSQSMLQTRTTSPRPGDWGRTITSVCWSFCPITRPWRTVGKLITVE